MKPCQVLCLGRPAVDYVIYRDLISYGLKAGEHRFVDEEWLQQEIHDNNLVPNAGGSIGNTAWVLGKLGIATNYIGAVGDDGAGQVFRDAMTEAGVHMPLSYVGKTKKLLVVIGAQGERAFLGTKDDVLLTQSHVNSIFKDFATGAKLALIENYSFKLQPEAALEFMRLSKEKGFQLLMTLPNHHILADYGDVLRKAENMADIIYGNRQEMDLWLNLNKCSTDKAYLQTRDSEGAQWRQAGKLIEVTCQAVENPHDVNGAGDSFLAGFVAGQVQRRSVEESMHLGHQIASITIGQSGPRPSGLPNLFSPVNRDQS